LQLEKISKLLAARKKKLQFATPQHTQVLVDSMDNKKSDDHHLSESDILISTDFVHKHPKNEDIQLNNLKHSTTDTSFSAPIADLNIDTDGMCSDLDDMIWNEETIRQVDDSIATFRNSQQTPPESMIPMNPLVYCHVFVSMPVQRVVHQHIVSNIPPPFPARRYIYIAADMHNIPPPLPPSALLSLFSIHFMINIHLIYIFLFSFSIHYPYKAQGLSKWFLSIGLIIGHLVFQCKYMVLYLIMS